MKRYFTLLRLFFALSLFIFIGCQSTTKEMNTTINEVIPKIKTVQPPFRFLNVPYYERAVEIAKGDIIKLDNGTVIKVPKNAFVDESGQIVKGTVNLKYREFHSASEIIASGIPMVNKGDESKYMETAGMFELKGSHKSGEIEVAKDKTIEIDMATFVKGNDFDFFFLDESTCNWENRGTADPIKNKSKQEKLKKQKKLPSKPLVPTKMTKEKFVFDLDVNYKHLPEMKGYRDVVWQYDGNSKSSNPEQNPWVFKESWTSAEVYPKDKSTGQYILILNSGKKKFQTMVKPVLKGDNYKNALAEFNKKNDAYHSIKKALKQERVRLAKEADLLRSYRLDGFGIYNWDIWKQPERLLCKATFDFGESIEININNVSVFLITGEERSVIRYGKENFDKFSFVPGQKNKMVAVLPGDRIAVFSENDFENLNINSIRQKEETGEEQVFEFKLLEKRITSMDELQKLISKLG